VDVLPVVPEIKKNRTIDQRIDLVLDLTRRLELLDELLRMQGQGDVRQTPRSVLPKRTKLNSMP
jgi:hypothetical protein